MKYFAICATAVLAMDGGGRKVLQRIRKAMAKGEAEEAGSEEDGGSERIKISK